MARGYVRRRSGVSFEVQVYLGRDPGTGRKLYHSETVRGEIEDAERRLTEILSGMDQGSTPSSGRRMTVAEYLEDWLWNYMESRVRLRTLEGYRQHVRGKIVPRIGRVQLDKLTPRHVRDMESSLVRSGGVGGRGLSPRTVLQTHRILSSALSHALRMGMVSRNVAAAVAPPHFPRYEARSLSWKECGLLLQQVPDAMFRTAFLLVLHTGLRRSELVGLQWGDVDLKEGVLSVRRAVVKLPSGGVDVSGPKSGRPRVIDLPSASVEAMRVHRDSPAGTGLFVFSRPDGRPLDPNLVTRVFRRSAERAGLEDVRFHDLRHTHATLLLSQDVHLKVVSERLGHSTVSITGDIYSHVLPTVQREAVERFGAAWRDEVG